MKSKGFIVLTILSLILTLCLTGCMAYNTASSSADSDKVLCQVCGDEALLDRNPDFDYLGGNYCAECLMEAYFNSLE